MIVAIINLKGGVGKTTTAVALSCAASGGGGRVRLIDADSQGSSTDWAYIARDETDSPLPFPVDAGNQANVSRLKNDPDEWVFIDCPPTGKVADEAVKKADFVIVPTTPSEVDMRQTWDTVRTIVAAGKPYAVLVVRSNMRTLAYRDAIAALDESGASYFDTTIPQREAIKNNFGSAFTEFYGYDEVFNELKEAM